LLLLPGNPRRHTYPKDNPVTLILTADPGIRGAISLLDSDRPDRLVRYWPMPVQIVQKAQNKNPSPEVEIAGVVKLFQMLGLTYDIGLFCLEKVGGLPKQSASSAFNFGVGYGALKAGATIAGIPLHEVPPSVWKAKMKAPKDKLACVALAASLLPGSASVIQLAAAGKREGGNADQGGCAETALLALYAARHVLNIAP
jgi:hypothetical protein